MENGTLQEYLEFLDGLKALPRNWDGYNADPIDHDAIRAAQALVRLLFSLQIDPIHHQLLVAGGRDGGVQINWENQEQSHELEIQPNGEWLLLNIEKATDRTTQKTFRPAQQVISAELIHEILSACPVKAVA